MRLALLGSDEEGVALARAARAAGHELAWCGDMQPAHIAELTLLRPPSDEWESLLDDKFVDGVIVGLGAASADLRLEQLQKLIGNEIPVLVTQLPVDSVLPFHELDMLRREKNSLVQRYHPDIDHPWIAQLSHVCHQTTPELGAVQQIALDRGLDNVDRQVVLSALARDIELFETLAGYLNSVSAIGAAGDARQLRGLSVQFIGPNEIPVRWSLAPNDSTQLLLTGERRRIEIQLAKFPTPWSAENTPTSMTGEAAFDAPRHAIDQFATAISAVDRGESPAAYSNWDRATAAMEVADVVELSLHKGKTIEVHHQQLTEQLAFRGTMSALGCALLLTGLFGVVIAGIVGDALGFPLANMWPFLLLGTFGIFLLVQLLPKLLPPRDS